MARRTDERRTARLLESKLEALALVTERAPAPARPVDDYVLAAAAATRHAVALELLSQDEACEIWAVVSRRHPGVDWCRMGPGLAA